MSIYNSDQSYLNVVNNDKVAVVQINHFSSGERVDNGSGCLVKYKSNYYIFTAAHVLDPWIEGKVGITVEGVDIDLSTSKVSLTSKNIDGGWIKLEENQRKTIQVNLAKRFKKPVADSENIFIQIYQNQEELKDEDIVHCYGYPGKLIGYYPDNLASHEGKVRSVSWGAMPGLFAVTIAGEGEEGYYQVAGKATFKEYEDVIKNGETKPQLRKGGNSGGPIMYVSGQFSRFAGIISMEYRIEEGFYGIHLNTILEHIESM